MITDYTLSHKEELNILYGATDDLTILDLTLEKVLELRYKGVSIETILKAAEWETLRKNHQNSPFMPLRDMEDLTPRACTKGEA